MGGGGGGSQPTETTVTNTDLPDYVEPYFKRLLQRGEAESLQGYTPYGGQRLSYFSPDELTSQAMTRGFATSGTPQQFTDASNRYGATAGLTPGYTGGTFDSGYTAGQAGPTYQAGQVGPTYQAGQYTPGYTGGTFDSGYTARDISSGYNPTIRQSGYRSGAAPLYDYQAGQMGSAYTPLGYEENLQRFMSPYQQNVTDIGKREAIRQSNIMGKGIGDAATAQGSLGGYREAIQQAERERNLGQQLGDIQTRGSQAAFESAQQQLERERAGGLGAAQLGLQRFGAEEAAKQQAAKLGLEKFGVREGAKQTQEQLSQAAFQQSEQSRQQKEQFSQAAYNAGESARQRASELGLSAQQQEEAAQQAQEKFSQSGFQMSQQALQAQGAQGLDAYQAQQAAMQQQGAQSLQAYQAGEQAKQQAAKLGLSAQQQEEAARQAQEKFGQSAYDLSNRYNLAAAQGLMGAGQDINQDAVSRIAALQGIGSQQRALSQASMDMGYQDFLRQQDYSKQKLSDFGGILRGVPVQPQQTMSMYQQQPGLFQQTLGAGLTGLGLYRGMGG